MNPTLRTGPKPIYFTCTSHKLPSNCQVATFAFPSSFCAVTKRPKSRSYEVGGGTCWGTDVQRGKVVLLH